jgi:transglutaminase-like putative cysteine protease
LFTENDSTGEGPESDAVTVQTHAWFEAAIPGFGWLALDPTNRQAVGPRHIKIGHGRDYEDVAPLHGTYSGPPEATLDVSVEIRRLAGVTAAQQQQQ